MSGLGSHTIPSPLCLFKNHFASPLVPATYQLLNRRQYALPFRPLQHFLHVIGELERVNGFLDIVICALGHEPCLYLTTVRPSENDNGQPRSVSVGPDTTQHFVTVQLGHIEIQDQEIAGVARFQVLQGRSPVNCFRNLKPGLFQHRSHQHAHQLVIVDH